MITKFQDNVVKRTIWWLEPAAYYFDFERKGKIIGLTIIETDDLHNESAAMNKLITIWGNDKEIFEPFRIVLKQFSLQTYEEIHWPCNLDKYQISNL